MLEGYIKGKVKQLIFIKSGQQIEDLPAEQFLCLKVNAKKQVHVQVLNPYQWPLAKQSIHCRKLKYDTFL